MHNSINTQDQNKVHDLRPSSTAEWNVHKYIKINIRETRRGT